MIQDLRGQTMGGTSRRQENQITKIARHHSGTADGNAFVFERHWRTLGWNTGGYHEIILRDGTVQLCYNANVVTNGIRNHNTNTYHICLVGNGNFTKEQEAAFDKRAKIAMERFNLKVNDVLGHREFAGTSTACPGIDMNIVRNRLNQSKVTPKKEESFMLEKAVVINSFADYPMAEPLANRLGAPIYTRTVAAKSKVAKEIYVAGGEQTGLQADKFVVLSGRNRFETARKIEEYLK